LLSHILFLCICNTLIFVLFVGIFFKTQMGSYRCLKRGSAQYIYSVVQPPSLVPKQLYQPQGKTLYIPIRHPLLPTPLLPNMDGSHHPACLLSLYMYLLWVILIIEIQIVAFVSFIWYNVFKVQLHCICILFLLMIDYYSFIHLWILGLFPTFGYCEVLLFIPLLLSLLPSLPPFVVTIEPRASHMPSLCTTTEQHP
jgi:hypothetical protein